MKYKVTRHPEVRSDLTDLTIFIGEYAGYDVAERKIAEIETALNRLSDFPHIGTVRNDVSPKLRVIPAADKAVIYFIADDPSQEVMVLGVSYAGADWQAQVSKRR